MWRSRQADSRRASAQISGCMHRHSPAPSPPPSRAPPDRPTRPARAAGTADTGRGSEHSSRAQNRCTPPDEGPSPAPGCGHPIGPAERPYRAGWPCQGWGPFARASRQPPGQPRAEAPRAELQVVSCELDQPLASWPVVAPGELGNLGLQGRMTSCLPSPPPRAHESQKFLNNQDQMAIRNILRQDKHGALCEEWTGSND